MSCCATSPRPSTCAATPGPSSARPGLLTRGYPAVMEDRDAAFPLSPAAARARRYRARQRGEDVPRRKPGPEPRSAAALRTEVIALRRQNRLLAAQLADLQTLRPVLALQRQRFAFTDVGRLRAALRDLTRRRMSQHCARDCASSAPRSRNVTNTGRIRDAVAMTSGRFSVHDRHGGQQPRRLPTRQCRGPARGIDARLAHQPAARQLSGESLSHGRAGLGRSGICYSGGFHMISACSFGGAHASGNRYSPTAGRGVQVHRPSQPASGRWAYASRGRTSLPITERCPPRCESYDRCRFLRSAV